MTAVEPQLIHNMADHELLPHCEEAREGLLQGGLRVSVPNDRANDKDHEDRCCY